MPLSVLTPPAFEPVTCDEAKTHLRVTHTDDDAYIDGLIGAARGYCERFTRRTYPTTTLKLSLDRFPPGNKAIVLPYPPLVSVTAVQYVDDSGTTHTLATSAYTVDAESEPGRVVPAYGTVWPSARGHVNDVSVTYVAGKAAASIPASVKQAMLLLIGHWYEHRESVVVGTSNSTLEMAVESLLWSERIEV